MRLWWGWPFAGLSGSKHQITFRSTPISKRSIPTGHCREGEKWCLLNYSNLNYCYFDRLTAKNSLSLGSGISRRPKQLALHQLHFLRSGSGEFGNERFD
jgi:hypothetical protein